MRIAIDARWIFPKVFGIGEYTRELIRHLAILDRDNSYVLLFADNSVRQRTIDEVGLKDAGNFETVLLSHGVFSPLSQLVLPRILTRYHVQLFHSTNYMIPLRAFPRGKPGRIKCVTTIHDVIPLLFPAHAPKSRKARMFPLYKRLMFEVGTRSDAIITDSRASARDIIRCLRIPESATDKVRTIHCGIANRFKPVDRPVGERDRTRTVLYVGRLDPYKNLGNLVRAFAQAEKSLPFPLKLTVAGSKDHRYPETPELAGALGIEDRVEWTGYVSNDELVALYQGADVLAQPSRYEGFGLQVVEAMACGLPVICSNAGALPEVAGDAAIMADPDDISGIADGLTRILTQPALAREMSARGFQRAAEFTWAGTAGETLQVYLELADSTEG